MTVATVAFSLFGGLGLASVMSAIEGPSANPQDWTLLGLVAALTLGIGTRMIIALDKNTAATNEQAKAIGTLANAIENSSRQHERESRDIRESVEGLSQVVNARLPARQ